MRQFFRWDAEKMTPLQKFGGVAMFLGAFAFGGTIIAVSALLDALSYLAWIPGESSKSLLDIVATAAMGGVLILFAVIILLPAVQMLRNELEAKQSKEVG